MIEETPPSEPGPPPGPLHGVRVVDLSTVLSGPLATMLLADQGADVVKVEAPGPGDLTRIIGATSHGMSSMFCVANRGKRSIVLDLSHDEGLGVLHRLVTRADVFVENFRPGVAERMGIGFERLAVSNPGLIYLSIAGFGFGGPLADLRVYDNLVQAASGMAVAQGRGGEPQYVGTLFCDKLTALTAAQAVTAALVARRGRASGQHIEVSMLDATISFLWSDLGADSTFLDPAAAPTTTPTGLGVTRHSDGWTASAPISDQEFQGWCRAFDSAELAADPRFATVTQRLTDPDLTAAMAPVVERARKLTVAEALERLANEGVSAVPVLRISDLPGNSQVRHNETFEVTNHPVAGPLRAPRPAARFGGTPAAPGAAAPTLGQHTDVILREAAYSTEQIQALRQSGTVA
jgi:crotonobetainyl-CoA:carnitine CoA-transferase CaiB-like acyl-CoA transferase